VRWEMKKSIIRPALFSRCLLVMAGLLSGTEIHAAQVQVNVGVITRMWTHSVYGNGDVWFLGTSGAGPCQAFWLRASDPGFKNLFGVLLAARAADRAVLVSAHDNELWSGSGTPSCRVDAIDFAD